MTTPQAFAQMQILLTPLVATDTYGTTIDVTQDIDLSDLIKGIGSVRKDVDFGDYDVGVFVFGNVDMRAINHDGKFNGSHDWRSLFPYKRDLAKVLIKFLDEDGNSYMQFKGLVDDDATRQDFASGEVRFRILSLDSIFRKTKITGGAISDGMSFSSAIKTILNVTEITNVLNYSASDINVSYDGTIDDGTFFDDAQVKDSLDQLLLASNSVLLVNGSDNIVVKARGENATTHNFYGNDNLEGRDNILNIESFNNGNQRALNVIKVNTSIVTDENLIWLYGVRQKKMTFDFITSTITTEAIANSLLAEFKVPKSELEMVVPTSESSQVDLLDKVTVDFRYRLEPPEGQSTLTVTGAATTGTAVTNKAIGNFQIPPNQVWKVIGKEDRAKNMTTKLKLREIGTNIGDGWA